MTTRWSLWPCRGGGGVQTFSTAVHRDGAAVAFQHAAAGAQLGFHSRDAVALLQAQPLGVADDGGALAQQTQHHQHGAKVGAVRKVDIHPVQGCFAKVTLSPVRVNTAPHRRRMSRMAASPCKVSGARPVMVTPPHTAPSTAGKAA